MEKRYPLDYIMRVPQRIEQIDDDAVHRQNQLKNVVMRIIIDIRDRKKKPKLKDFLQLYRTKKNTAGSKEEYRKKFYLLYGTQKNEADVQEDVKYDKLMNNLDRV